MEKNKLRNLRGKTAVLPAFLLAPPPPESARKRRFKGDTLTPIQASYFNAFKKDSWDSKGGAGEVTLTPICYWWPRFRRRQTIPTPEFCRDSKKIALAKFFFLRIRAVGNAQQTIEVLMRQPCYPIPSYVSMGMETTRESKKGNNYHEPPPGTAAG